MWLWSIKVKQGKTGDLIHLFMQFSAYIQRSLLDKVIFCKFFLCFYNDHSFDGNHVFLILLKMCPWINTFTSRFSTVNKKIVNRLVYSYWYYLYQLFNGSYSKTSFWTIPGSNHLLIGVWTRSSLCSLWFNHLGLKYKAELNSNGKLGDQHQGPRSRLNILYLLNLMVKDSLKKSYHYRITL